MDGVLVIDKPVGPTSHGVVARVRLALGERRIGHTGTLDPAASGVLPLVIGRATRLAQFLSGGDKTYDAVIRLGFPTDTGDAQGAPVNPKALDRMPCRTEIEAALDAFRGTFLQQPPAYSAKKIDGTRSYRMARRAVPALPAPARVTTHAVDLIEVAGDLVTLRLTCSAGFYVRSLAHDLGERLDTGGHVASLRRTACAGFTLGQAITLDLVERDPDAAVAAVVPPAQALPTLASVGLTAEGATRATHGRDLGPQDFLWGPLASASGSSDTREMWVKLLDQQGALLGIARPGDAPGILHPSVVLV